MDSLDANCKHNRIPRNCYLCYLHRNDNEPVNFQDMVFTTLSELKIRIAKLEEYKRLQDDENKAVNKCLFDLDGFRLCQIADKHTIDIQLNTLQEHRKAQIDENRAVSKNFDSLKEDVRYLTKEKIILEKRCEELAEKLGQEKDCILVECHKIDKRFAEFVEGLRDRTKEIEELQRVDKDRITHLTEWLEEVDGKLKDYRSQLQDCGAKIVYADTSCPPIAGASYAPQWGSLIPDDLEETNGLRAIIKNNVKAINELARKSSDIEERMEKIESLQKHEEDRVTKINGLWFKHDKRLHFLEEINQRAIEANPIKDIYERFKEIEVQQRHDMARITHHNEWLLENDKLKDQIGSDHEKIVMLFHKFNTLEAAFKESQEIVPFDEDDYTDEDDESEPPVILNLVNDNGEEVQFVGKFSDLKETLCMDKFTKPKTTGLTFEEAITAFKAGKKIRFHDGMSESTIYVPKAAWGFGFDYDKICRDHWEIMK